MEPDRIVLGATGCARDERSRRPLRPVPRTFRKIRTNPRTAEMIKYASNALLATAISFSNEIANLCAALGEIDIVDVMEGVHASAYLTVAAPDGRRARAPITSFFQAGCGFGGSCLPKDVKALIAHGERVGSPMPLLRSVIAVNEAQPGQVIRILEQALPDPGGPAGRRARPCVQARHRRRPRVARHPRDPAAARRGSLREGLRPVAGPEARKVLGELGRLRRERSTSAWTRRRRRRPR